MSTLCDTDITDNQRDFIMNNAKLRTIYNTSKSMFQNMTIQLICGLGQKNTYSISDLVNFAVLLELPLFRQYMDETDPNELREIESMIEEYLKYLCKYNYCTSMNIIKVRILNVLKMNLTIPVSQYSSSIGGVKITYNSTYRANKNNPITVPTDIANVIDEQFYNMSNNVREEDFVFTPLSSRVNLHGNVIDTTVKSILELQEFMTDKNNALNINVRPFVQIPRYG